jgi:hypothetical protein
MLERPAPAARPFADRAASAVVIRSELEAASGKKQTPSGGISPHGKHTHRVYHTTQISQALACSMRMTRSAKAGLSS